MDSSIWPLGKVLDKWVPVVFVYLFCFVYLFELAQHSHISAEKHQQLYVVLSTGGSGSHTLEIFSSGSIFMV